jgi:hypothetical protein
LRERLSLALDEAQSLERKVTDLQSQVAEYKAELKLIRSSEQSLKDELDRLKREHEEEIIVYHDLEFRRGRRTLGKWKPFCPKCHLPLTISHAGGDPVMCRDGKCDWASMHIAQEIWSYERELPQ